MRGPRPRQLLTAITVGGVYLAGGLLALDDRIGDLCFRALSRPSSAPVSVVEIDARSLQELQAWPPSRKHHALVLDHLVGAGAARVAFDLDFGSPTRPGEDTAFAEALERAGGRVVLQVVRRLDEGVDERRMVASPPIEIFARHAVVAETGLRPGRLGLLRRYLPPESSALGGTPTLGAALAGAEPGRDPFYLDYAIEGSSVRRLSYADALSGRFDPALVRGRAVIVGPTAPELGSHLRVPVQSLLPAAVLQAMAFESIVSGRTLTKPAPPWLFALTVALVLLLGPRLEAAPVRRGILLVGATWVGIVAVMLSTQLLSAVLIDAAPLMLGAAAVLGVESAVRSPLAGRRLAGLLPEREASAGRMRRIVESSAEAIITLREDGRIETFNAAAAALFGRSEAEVLGRPVEMLIEEGFPHGEARERREAIGLRRDGSPFTLEMSVSAFDLDGVSYRVAFLRDITERARLERTLRHQATHDALTDLPNRFLLRRRVDETLARARDRGDRVAFLMVDLDRFKEVNDTLGHEIGDQLLQRIGRRLKSPLGPDDTIARLGGDEFAILLPGADRERARVVAELLIEAVRRPFQVKSLALQVDVSIGVAMFPEHGTEANELIQRADVAMYAAKKVRNIVGFYSPEEDFTSLRHLALRGELRDAVDRDRFEVHFQPKVSGLTGRVAGVEALIRWNHPELGMLPPGEFIPLAEHTGLIKPITLWVMEAALGRCAGWRKQGIDLSIAVNCSARNLLDEDLPLAVAALLQRFEIDPGRLVLEITETAIIEDPRRALEVVTLLADLGVRISIDDFGTGYSSLEYLKRLPATELKIDRSFVMSMVADDDDAVIVRSTIDLAHNLGLQAVAEGVGTPEVWARLRALGCDLGQGYHFSPALPEERLLEWIRSSEWGLEPAPAVGERAAPSLVAVTEPSLT